jgi:RNA-directed DNA polymerase
LNGHYAYFGVTSNYRGIARFTRAVKLVWWRALARRSQRGLPWWKMEKLLERYPLPAPRIVHRYGT